MRLFRFLSVFLAFAVLAHGQAVRPFSGRWEDLRNRPADLVNTAALNVAIAPLVSTSALNTALAGYTSTSALNTALASYQPLDADLTAIAALSTTAFARAILEDPNAAAVRARIGAGTGMSNFSGAWADLTGRPTTVAGSGITDAVSTSALNTALASYATTTALAGYQPLDSTLTTLSGLGTTGSGSIVRNVAPAFSGTMTTAAITTSAAITYHSLSPALSTSGLNAGQFATIGFSGDTLLRRFAAREFQFGVTGDTNSYVIRGGVVSGTNVAAGTITIIPGVATGNAASGSLVVQTAPPGSSGTTSQTPRPMFEVGRLSTFFYNVPTAATGLPVGAIWRDGDTLKIVP